MNGVLLMIGWMDAVVGGQPDVLDGILERRRQCETKGQAEAIPAPAHRRCSCSRAQDPLQVSRRFVRHLVLQPGDRGAVR